MTYKVELTNSLRHKVFPPDAIDENLKMTNVGVYSVTHYKHALVLAHNIRKFFPLCNVVCESCGGVGGDTIILCQQFKKVICYEPDPVQNLVLSHNLVCFGIKNCYLLNHKYAVTVCDVLYIDPPWGGLNYKESDDLVLELGGIPLHKIIQSNKTLGWVKMGVIIKAPLNCKSQLQEFAKLGLVYISKIFHKSRHTYNLIIVRLD